MKYTFVDSDVFVRYLRYQRDDRQLMNDQLIHLMKSKKIRAATSIYNLLEVLGVLSFNVSGEKLRNLYESFCSEFQIKILAKVSSTGDWIYSLEDIYQAIARKQSLGDAFVATLVEDFSSRLNVFVSWNAKHFSNLSIPAMTPQELLKQ